MLKIVQNGQIIALLMLLPDGLLVVVNVLVRIGRSQIQEDQVRAQVLRPLLVWQWPR